MTESGSSATTDPAAALVDAELTPGQTKMLEKLATTFLVGWPDGSESRVAVVPSGHWMAHDLLEAGVDVEAEVARMPSVQTRYGSYGLMQPTPDDAFLGGGPNPWRLTLAGCLRLDSTRHIAVAAQHFVQAIAATPWRAVSPWSEEPFTAGEDEILRRLGIAHHHVLPYLREPMSTLPPLSNIIRQGNENDAAWTIPSGVYKFRGCKTPRDMVNKLLELNQPLPSPTPPPAPLTATAVADALDHLDATWHRRFAKGLFQQGGLDLVTALTTGMPVNTAAELDTALIALGSVISRWQRTDGRSAKAEDGAALIADSVVRDFEDVDREALLAELRRLEAVIHLRNGTAHPGSRSSILRGNEALGVPDVATPTKYWDHVRRAVIAAATNIRTLIR